MLRVARIQDDLESLYRLERGLDVASFVVRRSELAELPDIAGAAGEGERPEQVLIREGDELEVSLVLDDELLDPGTPWDLDRFCSCAEGVSHLLYIALAAEREAQVSRLELELQAEIDKFALLFLCAGMGGSALMKRLFVGFQLREAVQCEAEQQRYIEANRLAHQYCRYLEARFGRNERTEPLVLELRRTYRMGGARKLSYINGCRP